MTSLWERTADIIDPPPNPYRNDPISWGQEKLRETWWSKQREIILAVQKYRKVAVRSCHEAGKDFIAARAACHWIDTGTPGLRAVATTATTGDQVKGVLWKEIGTAHRKGDLIGRTNLTEWYIGNERVGFGRKVANYEPTAFHGTHATEGVLVIYDEADGINEELFQAGNSMAGNSASRQLAIGNPDNPDSYFASLFRPGSGWYEVHIDGYETPNFTDEGKTLPTIVTASLLDIDYVNDLRDEYGEDSPIFTSKVRGRFPDDATDGVVPWSKLTACKYVIPDLTGAHDLGVDVAGSEDGDATVIAERQGNQGRIRDEWVLHTDESETIVGQVVKAIQETGATRVKVDVIGVGFGVVGHLRALRKEGIHNARIIGVNVAENAANKQRFLNKRSEIWWEVARGHSVGKSWCFAPDMPEKIRDRVMGELIAPRYVTDAKGHTVVEPKKETKKRTKHSPDHADAWNLAFYEPPGTGKGRTGGKQISAARIG